MKSLNKLEKVLEENIGKWVGIRYILPNGDCESIFGVLREVNNDYIRLEGFAVHLLNRKIVSVVEVELRR